MLPGRENGQSGREGAAGSSPLSLLGLESAAASSWPRCRGHAVLPSVDGAVLQPKGPDDCKVQLLQVDKQGALKMSEPLGLAHPMSWSRRAGYLTHLTPPQNACVEDGARLSNVETCLRHLGFIGR
jgi:hypothetical protein